MTPFEHEPQHEDENDFLGGLRPGVMR
jgi:hypothetical protein